MALTSIHPFRDVDENRSVVEAAFSARCSADEGLHSSAGFAVPMSWLVHLAGAVVEPVVEVDRRADEGQVAKSLREIAELLAGAANLFGIQA